MATRLTLRTALRERLEDSSGSPLWSDGALNEALAEAMRQYGVRLPTASTATVAVVAGTSDYALPAGVTVEGIAEVLDGDGDGIAKDERWHRATVGPANAAGMEQAWSAWGGRLYLAVKPTANETFTLRYFGGRELVADDVTAQPIDAGDEPIVLALALVWCYGRRSVEDVKRGSVDRMMRLALAAAKEADELIRARRGRARGGVLG